MNWKEIQPGPWGDKRVSLAQAAGEYYDKAPTDTVDLEEFISFLMAAKQKYEDVPDKVAAIFGVKVNNPIPLQAPSGEGGQGDGVESKTEVPTT